MATTIMIARILGIYFAVSGIFVLMHKKTLGAIMKDVFNHPVVSYTVGLFLLVGGATLLYTIVPGKDSVSLFVKIISWAIVVKGLLYIFVPKTMYKMVKRVSQPTYMLMGVTTTLLGIYLVFFL